MTCFFIGHRDAPEELRPLLNEAVRKHITEYGVTHFTVGRYGNFDRLAAQAVKGAKEFYPVTLSLLLPYHPYDRPIQTPEGFDNTFYPPYMESVPTRVAIIQANRYMVNHSNFLIAYDKGYVGNTTDLVAAARRRENRGLMHVYNLTDFIAEDAMRRRNDP